MHYRNSCTPSLLLAAGPCGPVLPPLSKKLVISNCPEVDIAVEGTSEHVSVDCAANVTTHY